MHVDNLPAPPGTERDQAGRPPVVTASGVTKAYGRTRALAGVDLQVRGGEVLGLVGHNGAGKSTLMRMLAGLESCDDGTVLVHGEEAPAGSAAAFRTVRMAYQETSLCPDLTVAENMWISSRHCLPRLGWRRAASASARRRLDEVFPGHGVTPRDRVEDLSLAQRQMVEIVRACLVDRLDLLILDEPTESLGPDAARTLYSYVRRLAEAGTAVLLISHRIREVLSAADRVVVLRDGAITADRPAAGLTESGVLTLMGAHVAVPSERAGTARRGTGGGTGARVVAELRDARGGGLHGVSLRVRAGEVVGLAGLAGQGQQEVLERLWRPTRRDTEVSVARAYVPGDRQRSGVLPLWNVGDNLVVTAMREIARRGLRRIPDERDVVRHWVERLAVKGGADAGITELSGGNQQKVVVARAFASTAGLVLLDDPFRGVDVHTKTELYRLIREEAAKGRSIVWYSSENAEMAHCDRVHVFRAGRTVAELSGEEISEEQIIAVSFDEPDQPDESDKPHERDEPGESGAPDRAARGRTHG